MKFLAPGPWVIDRESVGKQWTDSVSIKDAAGGHVAHLTRGYEGDVNGDCCPSWCNARLIAAAPELMEALKKIAGPVYGPTTIADAQYIARQAIAKAEGIA